MNKASPNEQKAKHSGRWLRWLLSGLALLILLLVVFWRHLPYQHALSSQITRWLKGQGVEVVSLSVGEVGSKSATLGEIVLGHTNPLSIERLAAFYQLEALRAGIIERLELTGVNLTLYEKDRQWKIGGLEPLMTRSSTSTGSVALPVSEEALKPLPELNITSGRLNVIAQNAKAQIPFDLTFQKNPAFFTLRSAEAEADADTLKARIKKTALAFTLDSTTKAWRGSYDLQSLALSGLKTEIPVFNLKGTLNANAQDADIAFNLKDIKKTMRAEGTLRLPYASPEAGALRLSRLTYPWGGGTLSLAKPASFSFSGKKPLRATLKVSGVSLAAIVALAGEGKIDANGTVEGLVPVRYDPGGNFTISNASLSATGAGTLSMAPELLPAQEHQQMQEVQKALENFHYQTLGITLSLAEDESSVIRLKVAGSSPDAFNGKKVNLNIHLSGDLVPLLRQSLMPLQDASQFLKHKETR